MLINNNILNCQTRRRFNSFRGSESSENTNRTVKYKHYEEMSDNVLKARSIIKAYNDVQDSGKMKAFNAVPQITKVLLGTSLALAQPGKLAAKAAVGLGFLVVSDVASAIGDKITDKVIQNKIEKNLAEKNGYENEPKKKNILSTGLKIAAGVGVAALAVLGLKSTKAFQKSSTFILKEFNQLASEINGSKIGKFVEENINPFTKKHSLIFNLAPLGVVVSSVLTQLGLAHSLSDDMKEKTVANYEKGKAIKKFAREHFDSIEAQEI